MDSITYLFFCALKVYGGVVRVVSRVAYASPQTKLIDSNGTFLCPPRFQLSLYLLTKNTGYATEGVYGRKGENIFTLKVIKKSA